MDYPTARCSTATILVVDNEEDIRALFALMLKHAGYTAITAPSGDTALSVLTTTPVDVVLTDYEMPGMRGDQLITTIRAQCLPVKSILASGHPNIAQLAAECGADGYYRKGEPPLHLLACVAKVLEDATHTKRKA